MTLKDWREDIANSQSNRDRKSFGWDRVTAVATIIGSLFIGYQAYLMRSAVNAAERNSSYQELLKSVAKICNTETPGGDGVNAISIGDEKYFIVNRSILTAEFARTAVENTQSLQEPINDLKIALDLVWVWADERHRKDFDQLRMVTESAFSHWRVPLLAQQEVSVDLFRRDWVTMKAMCFGDLNRALMGWIETGKFSMSLQAQIRMVDSEKEVKPIIDQILEDNHLTLPQ